jgi:hypothetical protein
MQIEKLSDLQIKCTLTNNDLLARDINLLELAYGHEKAKNLFNEMLQRASHEFGFNAGALPLMVEAIPLPNESIVIIITKVEDPEEVDTRFSKFSTYSKEVDFNDMNFNKFNLMAGAKPQEFFPSKDVSKDEESYQSTFSFSGLDKVIDAAHLSANSYKGESSLYKHKTNGNYILSLKGNVEDAQSYNKTCNILTEYGIKLLSNYSSEAYYEEYFDIIIKNNALDMLSKV